MVDGQNGWHLAGDWSGDDRKAGRQSNVGRQNDDAAGLRVLTTRIQHVLHEDNIRRNGPGVGVHQPPGYSSSSASVHDAGG